MNTVNDWTDPLQAGYFLAENALLEDRALEDTATAALGPAGEQLVTCMVNAREELTVAGIPLAAIVYEILSGDTLVTALASEGDRVSPDTDIARISGTASQVLRGERVFLNILGRLCGIATLTSRFVSECAGTGVEILDTRKTTPCIRALEKYAVRMGGGTNHRFSLADMAMLKDNHLAVSGGAGSLGQVMARLRRLAVPVEIEVDSLSQLELILPLKPDRILLDNMTLKDMRTAVDITRGLNVYLEASGGISLETVGQVALTGVDGISAGALTHSVKCSDIGFDWSYNGGNE